MKSSAFASDEIKSAIHSCRKADFSSTKWIYSDEGGFSSKKPHLIERYSKGQFSKNTVYLE